MSRTPPNSEQFALRVALFGNAIMGIAGIITADLSKSDALLVGGLYSLVNVASVLMAGYVARQTERNPNPEFPYGFYANEALYVLFRSLVLLGILVLAVVGAIDKIVKYWNGETLDAIVPGPVLVYAGIVVVISFSLVAIYHRAWLKTGKQSDIIAAERYGAMMDGIMSAVAGLVLVGVQFLEGTALEAVVPIADSILVIILCSTTIGTPASLLSRSFRQINGKSSDPEMVAKVRDVVAGSLADEPFELIDFHMSKLGRRYFCFVHVLPIGCVEVNDLDRLRESLVKVCDQTTGGAIAEVIFTAKKAFVEEGETTTNT